MTHEPEWCEYGDCRDTSGHEPECVACHYLYGHKETRGSECICNELRACRERTLRETACGCTISYDKGRADALREARDAVEVLILDAPPSSTPLSEALAAIDALIGGIQCSATPARSAFTEAQGV